MTELTEDEKQEYEAQLEDTDLKALLIQQNSLLHAILRELQGPQEDSQPTQYKCTSCEEIVVRENRGTHATNEHNAPPNVPVDDLGLFARVD